MAAIFVPMEPVSQGECARDTGRASKPQCSCAEQAEDAGRGAAAARRRQVALVIAGTLAAGVLVATLGDARGYQALLAARQSQEQQMLGSWTADHGPRFLALEAKSKQKALAALATKHPGDQSSDDDESGVGDVKESVANKLFGAEAGSGGNGHEPPYEVEEDADVGSLPSPPLPRRRRPVTSRWAARLALSLLLPFAVMSSGLCTGSLPAFLRDMCCALVAAQASRWTTLVGTTLQARTPTTTRMISRTEWSATGVFICFLSGAHPMSCFCPAPAAAHLDDRELREPF